MAGKDYHIYVHKQQPEGQTPLTPQSPSSASSMAGSPATGKISLKSAALVTYGTMVAQKTISTLVGELAKNGNQTTSTLLSNAVGLIGATTAIIATQGLALIPMAIDGAVQAFNMSRTISRERIEREYLSRERGARLTFNQGNKTYYG